jgi:putative ABC transport system permease protein
MSKSEPTLSKNLFLSFNALLSGARALRTNKLRALLSLLGITIGIFAIITVFALVDSLKQNIRNSLESLGSDVVYVQRWPWGTGGDYPWWKYVNRPEVSVNDYLFLERNLQSAEFVVFEVGFRRTVQHGSTEAENTSVNFVSDQYFQLSSIDIADGRVFSSFESIGGTAVTVLGAEIAEALFPYGNAIGNQVIFMGKRVKVIGVLSKAGNNMLGSDYDNSIFVPLNFGRSFINFSQLSGGNITVRPFPGISAGELKQEIQMRLRTHRRLPPNMEDNFSLNEVTLLQDSVQSIFSVLTIAGLFIGGFSILVGGFGIANIMFVSVRERTGQIGIQKSLGAPNFFILAQFLTESVLLCSIGGLFGLAAVYGIITIVSMNIDFPIFLSAQNILLGLYISAGIGVISGFVPALTASRLRPVDAIRAN